MDASGAYATKVLPSDDQSGTNYQKLEVKRVTIRNRIGGVNVSEFENRRDFSNLNKAMTNS